MPLAWLTATCPAPMVYYLLLLKGNFCSHLHILYKNTSKPKFFKELLQLNISIMSSVMALGLYQIQKFKNTGITACGIKI